MIQKNPTIKPNKDNAMLAEFMTDEHEAYRESFAKFLENEVVPNMPQWEKDGMVSKEVWAKAGAAGFVAPWVETEYGGSGGDFVHSCILINEQARTMDTASWFLSLHNDVIVPYIHEFANEEQKKRWLPKLCDGTYISSIAMTEPDAGSDLKAIRTTAVKDGDDYILNGSKTFISNGQISNFCVVVAKTSTDARPENSISLFVVEGDDVPGYKRGRNLEKMGLKAQDTSELFFEDCRVPAKNMLGKEGRGFLYLMKQLAKERLVLAVAATAATGKIVEMTVQYAKERQAFGGPISKFQNTQFELAECATKYEVAAAFIAKCIKLQLAGENYVKEASMAKYFCTDMQVEVVNRCLQLYGGYGYMMEYPIAKAYVDSRIQPIYAGTNEIMKQIIAKKIGL